MIQWEYKRLFIGHTPYSDGVLKELSNNGNEAWELVCIWDGYAFFKRQKQVL